MIIILYVHICIYQTHNLYVIRVCACYNEILVEKDMSILWVNDIHNVLHDHNEFSLYANCIVKIVRIELRMSIKRARPARTYIESYMSFISAWI